MEVRRGYLVLKRCHNPGSRMKFEWHIAQAERCFRMAKNVTDPDAIAILKEVGHFHLRSAEDLMMRQKRRMRRLEGLPRRRAGNDTGPERGSTAQRPFADRDHIVRWRRRAEILEGMAKDVPEPSLRDDLRALARQCRAAADCLSASLHGAPPRPPR